MDRVVERARLYLYHVVEEAERRGLPTELAMLPVVESGLQPFAYSHAQAAGLWQFIPSTGRLYGLKQSWWYDGRRDVVESTRAALDYLQRLHNVFDGDWLLAIAAYNSGEGSVRRAIEHNRRTGKQVDFWSLRLPAETRAYVPRLLSLASIVSNPEQYGVTLEEVADKPYFQRVALDGQIDLALAAELAGISLEKLYLLNPAFNRWATDPEGPHYLLVPVKNVNSFTRQIANLPRRHRMQWQRHRVQRGQTLSGIAHHYQTTVALLRQVNNLRGTLICAGDSLVVPIAARSLEHYTLSVAMRKATSRAASQPDGTELVYIVRRGDTFWNIARKHAVSTHKLAKWNGIAVADPLRPGQRLSIWINPLSNEGAGMKWTTLRQGPSVTGKITRHIRYTVRPGDSLWNISRRFKVSVMSLRQWNQVIEGSHLKPGQKLDVFVDVTQQVEST